MQQDPLKAARLKAARYCAYRERSSQEVYDKLSAMGVEGADADGVIDMLRTEGFLDDHRFAKAYVHGKFEIKQWGRIKITYGLKAKGIPSSVISEALELLDEDQYMATLRKLAERKLANERENHPLKKKNRLYRYLTGKGYEAYLIRDIIDELIP